MNGDQETSNGSAEKNQPALIALISAVLAVASLLAIYWMVLPAVALGAIAVAYGIRGRRRALAGQGRRDMAVVAIVLGLVSILGTPWAALVAKSGEDYGRDCALSPADPDC